MLSKDKLILVFYINIDGLTKQQAQKQIHELMDGYRGTVDDSVVTFWFPVTNQDTRVECINPVYLADMSEQNYQKLLLAQSVLALDKIISDPEAYKKHRVMFNELFNLKETELEIDG